MRSRKNEYSGGRLRSLDAAIEAAKRFWAEILCITRVNFADKTLHTSLNNEFHEMMYERHYNQVAFDVWKQHREIMGSICSRIPIALGRQEAILREHQQHIDAIAEQNVARATKVLSQHIGDAGRHLVDQLQIEQTRTSRTNIA